MNKDTVDALYAMGKVFDVLVIDLNSIAHASLYQPNLVKLSTYSETHGENIMTGAIMGTVNTIGSLIGAFPDALVVGLWDGKAQWRYDMLPTYKDGRKADPNSPDEKIRAKAELQRQYKMQTPFLRMMLTSLGVAQVCASNAEADDLCGMVMDNLGEKYETLMVTGDSDWLQKLGPRASWFRSATPEMLITWEQTQKDDVGLVVDKVSFASAQEYLACKALAGDTSDAINGVAGIGLATALKYHREFGSFEAMWKAHESGDYAPKGVKATSVCTEEAKKLYARNFEMMSFDHSRFDDFETNFSAVRLKPDQEDFNGLCEQFAFTRLALQFDKFKRNHVASDPVWQKIVWSAFTPVEREVENTALAEKAFATTE